MLSNETILQTAENTKIYMAGCDLYKKQKVTNLYFDSDRDLFTANVYDGIDYNVSITFSANGIIDEMECECDEFYDSEGACRHIVAILKAISANWSNYYEVEAKSPKITAATINLLEYFEQQNENNDKIANAKILPTYHLTIDENGNKESYLEISIGNEKHMYIASDIWNILENLHFKSMYSFGKYFIYDPRSTVFDNRSKKILDFLNYYYEIKNEEENSYSYRYYRHSREKLIKLDDNMIEKFFSAVGDDSFMIKLNNYAPRETIVKNENPPFNLNVKGSPGFLIASLNMRGSYYYGIDSDFKYIYHKTTIYKTTPEFARKVKPLFKCFKENKSTEIIIPEAVSKRFLVNVVPELKSVCKVDISENLDKKYLKEQLITQLYMDRKGNGITAKVLFKYGEIIINPLTTKFEDEIIAGDNIIIRNNLSENNFLQLLIGKGFQKETNQFSMMDNDRLYEFLQNGINNITKIAQVFYSDDFKKIKIQAGANISAKIGYNLGSDALELTLLYEETSIDELKDLLRSYTNKKRYYRLKNGTFINIEGDEKLKNATELLEHLDIDGYEDKIIELPKYRAMYIESISREKNKIKVDKSKDFKNLITNITKPKDDAFPLPDGITGELRDYQKTGFKWLKTLSHYGMSGILADDMGLGKTLQMIAFLLSEKQIHEKSNKGNEKLTNIVIAPTSLVYNWQDEVNKFAPTLKIVPVSGLVVDRENQIEDARDADIIVTSYALIRRDIEKYKDFKFNYCILDEAQHIKNHNTLNSKTVKSINARGCFAMTGTPVENNLTELWSIFDFTMPGYLLNHNKFSNRYEMPIIKNQDTVALKELSRHISPFIMRRLKKDVLKELPDKIESRMICEMKSEQSKLYDAYLLKAKNEFEQEVAGAGFEKSQIKILALLTRLRQICCHPAMFIENYRGESGKMEMLLEILEDAKESGHKVLVFSQFTSMLEIIEKSLNKAKISYFYLNGSTKPEIRRDMVKLFNKGEKDVFLISLKAGGTGLNLTGADMVIHVDPWWNPAVEDQATDRAHRIGQENVVQVFKLITKNTIEEKIYNLQLRKRELIDSVIKPGETFISRLSVSDVRSLFEH